MPARVGNRLCGQRQVSGRDHVEGSDQLHERPLPALGTDAAAPFSVCVIITGDKHFHVVDK